MKEIGRLRDFVKDFTRLVDVAGTDEETVRTKGAALLKALVSQDDWLPDACAEPDPGIYRQYLLWCDPFERFSVVSFVWGPGQTTPVHDHTVWGLIGMLRGGEMGENFTRSPTGELTMTQEERLYPGNVTAVSPRIGDIHRVSNALADEVSISIHVYGANIGAVARHVYDETTGAQKDFVSGYSSHTVPNLFDRSEEVRLGLR
tara:strand:+ start:160 stop:768 length:609 start_codon:yes stop_codon:yes gene_type:complete